MHLGSVPWMTLRRGSQVFTIVFCVVVLSRLNDIKSMRHHRQEESPTRRAWTYFLGQRSRLIDEPSPTLARPLASFALFGDPTLLSIFPFVIILG